MFTRDIGIDLGTANTKVCIRGKNAISREPSVVAYDVRNDEVRAVGNEAKEMIGRTPGSIVAVRPLKHGVIADYDVTAAMLKKFIKDAMKGNLFSRARVLISIPAGVTEVEVRAVYGAAKQAGATEVDLIEEPMAAAIGAGLPVKEASGNMVVNIGGGTTEIAVVSLGDIVTAQSIRVAGDNFDESIMNYIRRKHNLLVGERTAEDIKIKIGSVLPYEDEGELNIKGRNNLDGLPTDTVITAEEVRKAIKDDVKQIVNAVKLVLEKTPPELAADIIDKGMTLTGGGAYLRGIDELLQSETGMQIHIADNPMECVAKGIAKRLDTMQTFDTFIIKRGKKFR